MHLLLPFKYIWIDLRDETLLYVAEKPRACIELSVWKASFIVRPDDVYIAGLSLDVTHKVANNGDDILGPPHI